MRYAPKINCLSDSEFRFAVYNDSIAHYHSDLITYVVTVGTLLFGVNFNLYFYILLRKIKFFFQDEELRTYFAIVSISTGLIFLNIFGIYHNLADSFKYSFFEVSTIITTTGFGLTDNLETTGSRTC